MAKRGKRPPEDVRENSEKLKEILDHRQKLYADREIEHRDFRSVAWDVYAAAKDVLSGEELLFAIEKLKRAVSHFEQVTETMNYKPVPATALTDDTRRFKKR